MAEEIAIALPFSIDPYGKVSQTKEQSKIWADKVRSVIGTALKERVMRPLFGTDISSSVYEGQDFAELSVKDAVATAFNTQLQRLQLQSVSSVFDTYTNTLTVDVTYALPNDEVVSTTIGILSISGNLIPREETL